MILKYIFFFLLAFNIVYFALHFEKFKANLQQVISSKHEPSSIEHKLSGYQKPAQHTCIHLGPFEQDATTNAAIRILKDNQIPAFAIRAARLKGNYSIRLINASPNSQKIIELRKTLEKSQSLGYEFFDNKLVIGSFASKKQAIRYKNKLNKKNYQAFSPQVISLNAKEKVFFIQIQDNNAKALESKKSRVQSAFRQQRIHFSPRYLKPSSPRCV